MHKRDSGDSEGLRRTLRRLSPGTPLREGVERILRGHTGALIVLGFDDQVEQLCTGGFVHDVPFTPTRLRELAKMDGAIVLSTDGKHIRRSAVHLMPSPSVPTEESGTRHRTAERVSRQTGYPVISVSQSMGTIGLFVDSPRYLVEDTQTVLANANQALATLERYKSRLNEVTHTLSALEVENTVTVRDVSVVLQRLEMVRRIADEIDGYIVELGTQGRLIALQLDELMAGVEESRTCLISDYLPSTGDAPLSSDVEKMLDVLDDTAADLFIDPAVIAEIIGFVPSQEGLEHIVSPRGYRLLTNVPRLPHTVADRLVQHFGTLQALLAARVEDLRAVEGVGTTRAHIVRESLSRLAESSIMDRYRS